MAGAGGLFLRTPTLVLSVLLAAATFAFAAPPASAFAWCSEPLNNGPPGAEDCDGNLLCVGHSGVGDGFRCQRGVRHPCETAQCEVSKLSFCSSLTQDGCHYMLCWHPHYNQWGTVSWCDVGLYWPCQYCVPPEWDGAVVLA